MIKDFYESRAYTMSNTNFKNHFILRDDSNITSLNELTIRDIVTKSYLINSFDRRYDETLKQHNIAIKFYKNFIINIVKKLILVNRSD